MNADVALQKQLELSKMLNNKISIAQTASQQLAIQLRRIKQDNQDATLQSMSSNCRQHISNNYKLSNYRTLQGHFDKVSSCAWYPDSTHLVSSSQDGFLLVWDTVRGLKTNLIELDDPYIMGCDVSSNGKLIATGGLDNTCTVYKLDSDNNNNKSNSLLSILKGHKEYISELSFLHGSSSQLITCSGDKSSILWDTNKGGHVRYFYGHLGDILSLSVNKQKDPNLFVTCSSDRLAMLWDIRDPLASRKFLVDQRYDSSEIEFFPDGYCFACGCDDGNIKLFDTRADGELSRYSIDNIRKYADENNLRSTYINYNNSNNNNNNLRSGTATSTNGICDNNSAVLALDSRSIGSMKSSIQASLDNPGVLSLCFSISGRLMFTSYAESSSVFVWDVIMGEVIGTLNGHNNIVSKIKISDDGLGVATASRDETIKIWST